MYVGVNDNVIFYENDKILDRYIYHIGNVYEYT
ncbi:MAG: hypothetical protein K0S31_474 [Sphingobacterium multivorum]|jgi:hypothetical protein|nr:hypothetical protein [Sphingobacterium multivorum]